MDAVIEMARTVTLDTAKRITQGGEKEAFEPSITAGAVISYEIELVQLKKLIMELGESLDKNWTFRKNAQRKFNKWKEQNEQQKPQHDELSSE